MSGLGFSTVILIYTVIGFFTLRYLLVKRLGVNNAELQPNLQQIMPLRNFKSSSKLILAIKVLKITYFLLLGGIYVNHHAPTFGPTLKLIDTGEKGSQEIAEKILAGKRWPAIAVDFM